MERLQQVRVVLVEPAGPLNVGAIARILKNMGLHQLFLVNPQCDPHGAHARQMAVHAQDVLHGAQIVPTLADALRNCRRVIATTGREQTTLNVTLEPPSQCLPWLLMDDTPGALVFGREDRGLANEELNQAQRCLYIPSDPIYPSLNLAQAVAICAYELRMGALGTRVPDQAPSVIADLPSTASPAPHEQLEGYLQDLEALLLTVGYLHPHTRGSRMEKIRQIYQRSLPSDNDIALLRGMIRQMRWALRKTE
ncbi:RNA methyltransferase [filamentous cyanobacterium LEGE 07170]|nr:RNA methyltransferase [filamentous cyanobacterium LEGE 07170]